MKRTFLALFLLIGISLQAQELTVASYNIRYANDSDAERGNAWSRRCPIICNQIMFYDFDVFGAQEVLHSQLVDMQKELPCYDYVGVGRDDGKTAGEYAPIFYKKDKLQLLTSGHFWLSEQTDHPNRGWDAALPRICTWAQFEVTGQRFWFFNLHMDHIGTVARSESAKLVLAKIQEMCGGDPVMLTGDFNVDQHNESYALLHGSDTFEDCYEVAHIRYALNGTFNAYNPNGMTDSRIDHIFVSPTFKVHRYGVLTDSYRTPIEESESSNTDADNAEGGRRRNSHVARTPSDHYPVLVKLSF